MIENTILPMLRHHGYEGTFLDNVSILAVIYWCATLFLQIPVGIHLELNITFGDMVVGMTTIVLIYFLNKGEQK
jgi:uncharacterized membrane protein